MLDTFFRQLRANLRPASRWEPPQIVKAEGGAPEVWQTEINSHVDGFEFVSPKGDFSSIHLAHEHDYERHLRLAILADARGVTNAIDVGANVGLIALPLSRAISGTLYCFELSARNAKYLAANALRNECSNISVFPFGIGDGLESRLLKLSENTTLNTMKQNSTGDGIFLDDVQITPVVSLDLLFGQGPDVDLIKIDVDGWDLQVLRGARQLLRRCQPILYTEYCPELIEEVTGEPGIGLLETLLDMGYTPTILGPNVPASAPGAKSADELADLVTRLLGDVVHLKQTHVDLRWHIDGHHRPHLFA